MITLPTSPVPRAFNFSPVDFGLVIEPPLGAEATRIDRPGTRYVSDFEFPPMAVATARVFEARLERALSEGLRLPWPLAGISQAGSGMPLVDGSVTGGTTLPIRSATVGFEAREGYWLNVVDGDGTYYLHRMAADATVNGSGEASLSVWPPLRAALSDGDTVIFTAPQMEGLVTSLSPIPRDISGTVTLGFTLKEAV